MESACSIVVAIPLYIVIVVTKDQQQNLFLGYEQIGLLIRVVLNLSDFYEELQMNRELYYEYNIFSIGNSYFVGNMGNSIERKVNSLKRRLGSEESHHPRDNTIGIEFVCPSCGCKFGPKTHQNQVHEHLTICLQDKNSEEQEEPLRPNEIVPSKNEHIVYNYNIEDYLYVKTPIDQSFTKFKWEKAPIKLIQPFLLVLNPDQIKTLSFQEKTAWFRHHLERMRIPWMSGADFMKIEKNNVLMSSLIQSKKVNMYKEVKIQFVGDKVNDAGGLLREWMHMVVKEMFDESTGMFSICKTDDVMYKLKWDEDVDEEFSTELLTLFGIILGKAIFEKISINSYLDRTLLRQLSSRHNKIELYDIFGYDKELYEGWNFLLNNQINDMGLETYFVITKQNTESSTLDSIELIEGGANLMVTDENKKMFIDLCIETICQEKVARSVDCIRKGLYKIIPENLIRVFQPFEVEMLIYGVPYIDVKDWKLNTEYKGQYNEGNKIVQWFWEVMDTFNQQQLANLLKFSTGSSRTPIHGFKKLESNRGNFSKFIIESAEYNKQNPYPKGHTCFNRLELPKYPNKQALRVHLNAIVNSNLDGVFGLD